jgi:hypothetical protein
VIRNRRWRVVETEACDDPSVTERKVLVRDEGSEEEL